jgi:hypothetical protein
LAKEPAKRHGFMDWSGEPRWRSPGPMRSSPGSTGLVRTS